MGGGILLLFRVNKSTKNISLLNEVSFQEFDILEVNHIERWVMESPEILGEELYILTNEFSGFDRTNERLDILAIDKEGNLVIVELKRDDSGKTVELQAIKYAAYCSTLTIDEVIKIHKEYLKDENLSYGDVKKRIEEFTEKELESISDRPRIIIASRSFRPEVTATVLWLRKFGIDISCVKFTVYDLNNDEIAIESSVVIPLPEAEEYLIRVERKETSEREIFYKVNRDGFLRNIKDKVTAKFLIDESAIYISRNSEYLQLLTNERNVHYEFCFRGKRKLEVGIHFEKTNDDINGIKSREIEEIYGEQLKNNLNEEVKYRHLWNQRKWSRVFIELKFDEINEALEELALERMKIFLDVLGDKYIVKNILSEQLL